MDSFRVVGLDQRAITALTRELVTASGDVEIALAIRSCSELFVELQIRIRGGVDRCCFFLLVLNVEWYLQQDTYIFAQVELLKRRRGRS